MFQGTQPLLPKEKHFGGWNGICAGSMDADPDYICASCPVDFAASFFLDDCCPLSAWLPSMPALLHAHACNCRFQVEDTCSHCGCLFGWHLGFAHGVCRGAALRVASAAAAAPAKFWECTPAGTLCLCKYRTLSLCHKATMIGQTWLKAQGGPSQFITPPPPPRLMKPYLLQNCGAAKDHA